MVTGKHIVVTVQHKLCKIRRSSNTVNMPNKSKTSSTARNSLKQQLQLKVTECNEGKDLFKHKSNRNEGPSILREHSEFMKSQKEYFDRSCGKIMRLQLTNEELTTLAKKSSERNVIMLKCKQTAKTYRTDASYTESAFSRSTAPSPNLERKHIPLRKRAMKYQFPNPNNQSGI